MIFQVWSLDTNCFTLQGDIFSLRVQFICHLAPFSAVSLNIEKRMEECMVSPFVLFIVEIETSMILYHATNANLQSFIDGKKLWFKRIMA